MHLITAMQQMHRIVNQRTAHQKIALQRTAHQKIVLQRTRLAIAQIADSWRSASLWCFMDTIGFLHIGDMHFMIYN